ncbi:hypothetical protein H7J88_25485 [Mycolicibacterium flavescens]|uniref:Uncharacterized protein n=1 Tax=Mycolicibacterium flavescens TaxID=1776 RepID=A0A1E3RDN2_MYCFV|nr:hypothetical protein [Mycolicibacterium flavescens]MCV7282992.1 hypothetical protein [Mycolicibacterium flavescens]ODQ87582.1 hypothetical protein BHQ18_23490 [Mycolicibacterium flavescens]
MTTATTGHGLESVPTDSLLRFALRTDATLCAALGLVIATAADPLSRLSGLSATSEWIAGAALVGYGTALYLAAGVPQVRRVGVGVLAGNVAFAATAVLVLVAGWLPLTGFGAVSVLTFAALTLLLAYVQYRGVRRLDAAPS